MWQNGCHASEGRAIEELGGLRLRLSFLYLATSASRQFNWHHSVTLSRDARKRDRLTASSTKFPSYSPDSAFNSVIYNRTELYSARHGQCRWGIVADLTDDAGPTW